MQKRPFHKCSARDFSLHVTPRVRLSPSLPLGETHALAAVRAQEWVGKTIEVRAIRSIIPLINGVMKWGLIIQTLSLENLRHTFFNP
jgi:hypothetical protein